MDYKQMIEDAKAKGVTSEKMMWQSIDDVDMLLCILKKEHPKEYWTFLRRQHGNLYGGHYTEEFARWDVSQMKYTNRKNEKKEGEYWSVEQVEEATKGMPFPSGVTKWDKYVAFNAMYSDTCKKFEDAHILDIAHLFYFADEDWPNPATKVWDYFCCKNK